MHTSHTPDRYIVTPTGVHVCEHDRLRSQHRRCPNHAHSRSCSAPGRQDLFEHLWSRRTAVEQDALPWPYLHSVGALSIVMSWVRGQQQPKQWIYDLTSMSRHCNLSHSSLLKQHSEIMMEQLIQTMHWWIREHESSLLMAYLFRTSTTVIISNASNVKQHAS